MESIIKPRTATSTSTPNGTTNPSMARVSPDMATQWLETMQYEHQRSVRQEHVEYLAEEMRRGRFVQGTQIHVVQWEDQRVIVDGQHRLWAIVESGIAQHFSILRTKVERKEDIAWIYGNTDIGMRRTGTHLLGALELDTETGCTKTEIRHLNGAISFMATGCLRNSHGPLAIHKDDMVRFIRLYAPFGRAYFKALDGCGDLLTKRSSRAATLGIALLTWRFAKPVAESHGEPSVEDFWKGAVFDDGVQIGDPRKMVNRHLLTVLVGSGGAAVAGDVVSSAYSARLIASCFNAYMERRTLTKAMVRDAQSPLRLHGVPNDVEQWLR